MDRVPNLAEDNEVEDGQNAEGDQVDEEQIHPVNVDLQQTNTPLVLCTEGVSYPLFISLMVSKLLAIASLVCHFRAQQSLAFQGPSLPMALVIDLPASKSLRPTPCKQQVH